MKKPDLTKADVEEAVRTLRQKHPGREPGVRAIHALLGRGSLGTIYKFRKEMDNPAEGAPTDQPELIAQFHNIWTAAKEAGRRECAEEIAGLQADLAAFVADTERLEGELLAAQRQIADTAGVRDGLILEMAATRVDVNATRVAAEHNAAKAASAMERLSSMQAAHAAEIADNAALLRAAETARHEAALALANARAALVSANERVAREEREKANLVSELAEAGLELQRMRGLVESSGERLAAMQTKHAGDVAVLLERLLAVEKSQGKAQPPDAGT